MLTIALLSAFVGPVIDIQVNPTKDIDNFERHSLTSLEITCIDLNVCCFDALIVLRPYAHLRNGNCLSNALSSDFLQALPFHDSAMLSMISSLPCSALTKSSIAYHITNELAYSAAEGNAKLGFTTLFSLCKPYSNMLFAEVHQLVHSGQVRAVALASTEGLSCGSVAPALLMFQPVYVPCGTLCLGRIFNVLGATMDGWFQLNNSGLSAMHSAAGQSYVPVNALQSVTQY
jgi:hypothetical protein